MAINFRTIVSREHDTLHLRLEGDFDGSSALELVNALLENGGSVSRVMIHTDGLGEVHPFGKAVFHRHLPVAGRLKSSVSFVGKNAGLIAPEQLCDGTGVVTQVQFQGASLIRLKNP
jgi:hypothetical protein